MGTQFIMSTMPACWQCVCRAAHPLAGSQHHCQQEESAATAQQQERALLEWGERSWHVDKVCCCQALASGSRYALLSAIFVGYSSAAHGARDLSIQQQRTLLLMLAGWLSKVCWAVPLWKAVLLPAQKYGSEMTSL